MLFSLGALHRRRRYSLLRTNQQFSVQIEENSRRFPSGFSSMLLSHDFGGRFVFIYIEGSEITSRNCEITETIKHWRYDSD